MTKNKPASKRKKANRTRELNTCKHTIKDVASDGSTTVALWSDGTKTVIKND